MFARLASLTNYQRNQKNNYEIKSNKLKYFNLIYDYENYEHKVYETFKFVYKDNNGNMHMDCYNSGKLRSDEDAFDLLTNINVLMKKYEKID